MAEEITRIVYDSSGRFGMKIDEVLNVFQDRKTQNQTTPIDLTIHCTDKRRGHNEDEEFSETAEMRSEILDNIVHINHFTINNFCKKSNENVAWFNYLHQFLQADHGGTKYVVEYRNRLGGCANHLSLEHATKLSDALRSNNNEGRIESFILCAIYINTEVFQTIWNALLKMGVPNIELSSRFSKNRDDRNHNNNDMNFAGLSTNMSLKRLYFYADGLSQHNWKNLFLSIMDNKGLEQLEIHSRLNNRTEILPCFTEMLRKNITLKNVEASNVRDDDVEHDFNRVIIVETKSNRKWNQYLMKRREEEEENASAITTPLPPLSAHLAAAAERKRKFKMGCLLNLFRNKLVIRDTILFHFLSETPDLWIDSDVQQNVNQVFRN